MDILAQAKSLEKQGRSICHLEVGEPDFPTARCIIDAGIRSLDNYQTHYTPALGLPELRLAIAEYYQRKFSLDIDANRVIVTPGASGALQLAIACLTDAGDNILLPDPGYPCNRNIAELFSVQVKPIEVQVDDGFQLTAEQVAGNWDKSTRAAMVSTPSNPTGAIIAKQQLQELAEQVEQHGGRLVVDEIYQGLVYDEVDYTALEITDECFVINSFSKYFGMTGWRVGWMVVPEQYVNAVDRIAQNIFLAPSTIAQYAAIEALKESTQIILDERRDEFERRRDFLLPALEQLGFAVAARPQGAFYIYASCEKFTDDSFSWIKQLLDEKGVALTPGIDFGRHLANQHCRFAYTRPLDILQQAVDRNGEFINQ